MHLPLVRLWRSVQLPIVLMALSYLIKYLDMLIKSICFLNPDHLCELPPKPALSISNFSLNFCDCQLDIL